jgi:hypothetical protein
MPAESTRLGGGPEPVVVRMQPSMPFGGQDAELEVSSPGADSIVLESGNRLDRFSAAGAALRIRLPSDFGDTTGTIPFAVRWQGRLLDVQQRPATIRVCRQGSCREIYHELPRMLPEQNQHSVSLTAGWSSVFARRSITGAKRTVLFREALQDAVWTLQGEWFARDWNGQLKGFFAPDERGASLDVSRALKRSGDIRYGLAMHLGASRSDWLPELPSSSLRDRTVYQAGLGPTIMLRGITASSLFGIYSDGVETLQTVSTRVSANGELTAIRQPVTFTAEKTFAFGRGPIISRRRDATESISVAIRVLDDFAVKAGIATHRIAWPGQDPADDLRGAETLFTLGGQYSLSW